MGVTSVAVTANVAAVQHLEPPDAFDRWLRRQRLRQLKFGGKTLNPESIEERYLSTTDSYDLSMSSPARSAYWAVYISLLADGVSDENASYMAWVSSSATVCTEAGFKQAETAAILNVSERTVRNGLSHFRSAVETGRFGECRARRLPAVPLLGRELDNRG